MSIRFELGHTCDAEGRWRVDLRAVGDTVVGPMSRVGRTGGLDLAETVGAYIRPGCASHFFDVPLSELLDSAVPLGDVWRTDGSSFSNTLAELNEAARITRLECLLLSRLQDRRRRMPSLDVEGMAAGVVRSGGRTTVERMTRAAGVSRQYLTRAFRARVGMGPKQYSRVARFQSVLAHAGTGGTIDWARTALDMGFADQSHMIAECRHFSGLTPQSLADRRWFHPFIERAKVMSRGQRFGR
ncbi:MAG: helix-turn-helix domain-containing protein [Vicinamibacterales bacterium]